MKIKKIICLALALAVLLSMASTAAASGKVTVTVKYVTGEKNTRIADTEKISGIPGTYFQIDIKDIKGYTFVGFTSNTMNSFVFPNKDITMLVHYAKGVTNTIKYVDVNGNKIAASTKISGKDGQEYDVETPYIGGYTFLRVEDPNNGVFKTKDNTIKVVYQPKTGTGNGMPAVSTVHLSVKCVDMNTGATLTILENRDIAYNSTIDLSSYSRSFTGYNFNHVTVNGIDAQSSVVRLVCDTSVVYYYTTKSHWSEPIMHDNMLTITAVNRENGRIIQILDSRAVPNGTNVALSAPYFNGYVFSYYVVDGARNNNGIITVYGDTNVTLYYAPVAQATVPTIPTNPTVPTIPTSQYVPSVPTVSTIPTTSTESTIPTVPTIPTTSTETTVPVVPVVSSETTVPTIPTNPA